MTNEPWIHGATSYTGWWSEPTAAAEESSPIALPKPRTLALPLGKALAQRASCRQFSGEPLELNTLSSLLGAAYGSRPEVDVDGASFRPRPVPSAGATYPLELHLLVRAVSGLESGSYRYSPEEHHLVQTGPGLPAASLADVFLGQPYLQPAATVVILVGALGRTTSRYGDRGYRYVLFEAGHVAQSLMLAAAALEAGSLALGGFFDDALAAGLRLPPEQVPLYGVALGPATTLEPGAQRQLGSSPPP